MSILERDALQRHKELRLARRRARRRQQMASGFVAANLVFLSLGVFWLVLR